MEANAPLADRDPGLPTRPLGPAAPTSALTPGHAQRTTIVESAVSDPAATTSLAPSRRSAPPDGIPESLRRWDRYEVLGLLGAGGMGVVYKARDPRLNRLVALKIIHPSFGLTGPRGEAMSRRFHREARLQAALDHPHICKVYEIGELPGRDGEAGSPYIAMQLITGQPLHRAQAELTMLDKVRLLKEVAEALHAAHRQGLIHRDIKPSNIMVERTADGGLHPYVMDFGLARETAGADHSRTGAIEGTPAYMSPEQARGDTRNLDRRSDVYSLGVTLYELLAGQSPYLAVSEVDILMAILVEEPRPLRAVQPLIPQDLEAVTLKCLEKEPERRYDSARALADDLGRYLDGEPVVARRVGPLARLVRRARKQKLLYGLGAALLVSLLGLFGSAVRTRLQAMERERQAQKQAELAEQLGQQIKDMEWTLRSARQLPRHDLGREGRIVRQRMAQLERDLRGYGELGRGLGHYALGRGYMALHEYPQALSHLVQAQKLGNRSPELEYAIGFVLGKHFEKALHEARLAGGGDWARKQLQGLEQQYLNPAIQALQRSRQMKFGSSAYLDGLIAFYQRDYAAALRKAEEAQGEAPWLYEASMLAGDVHLARALAARDSGRYPEAESEFAVAVGSFEAAAEVGPSDAQVYEGLAEAWVRWIEMSLDRGQPTEAAYQQALAATDRLLAVEPDSINGLLKRAFAAQMTMAVTGAGLSSASRTEVCLGAAQAVLARQPGNPYASDLAAGCTVNASEDAVAHGRDPGPLLRAALELLEPVIRQYPHFLWGVNDLAVLYATLADYLTSRGAAGARPALEKSLEYYAMAHELDPGYLKALSNALSSYGSLVAISQSEDDIQALLGRADTLFLKCNLVNDQSSSCANNYFIAYSVAASRLSRAGRPVGALLRRALASAATARSLGASYLDTEQYTALLHLTDARELLAAGQAPQPALAELDAALGRCRALAADDPMCATLTAQREWMVAAGRQQQGQPGQPVLAALERAVALAQRATELGPMYPEGWQTLAESHLRVAEALGTGGSGRPAREHVAAGLQAVERLFARNPNQALGRATQGALLLLSAQGEREPAARKHAAEGAAAALTQAVRLDPLLADTCSEPLEQAQALASRPVLAHASTPPGAPR